MASARSSLDEAQRLEKKGDFAKAADAYAKHVAENPEESHSLLKVAELSERGGSTLQASAAFKKLAQFHVQKGFKAKGAAAYRQAIRIVPDDVGSIKALIEILKEQQKSRDGVAILDAAIKESVRRGNKKIQLELTEELVKIEDTAEVNLSLADALVDAGRKEEACRQLLGAAERLHPKGNARQESDLLERVLELDSGNKGAAIKAGAAALEQGNPKRCLSAIRIALDSHPQDIDLIAIAAQAFDVMPDPMRATLVHREVARRLKDAGRGPDAREHWLAVLRNDPADEEAKQAAVSLTKKGALAGADANEVDEALSFLGEDLPAPPTASNSFSVPQEFLIDVPEEEMTRNLTLEVDSLVDVSFALDDEKS